MKYKGSLYAKIGGKFIELREDSEYVDGLERQNAEMLAILNEAQQLNKNDYEAHLKEYMKQLCRIDKVLQKTLLKLKKGFGMLDQLKIREIIKDLEALYQLIDKGEK